MQLDIQQNDGFGIDDQIEAIRKEMLSRGIYLKAGRNFRQLAHHVASRDDRSTLHDQFDPESDMDGAVSAFWVCGFDPDGGLLHTQAAHLLDLRHCTVADHIRATIPKYRPKVPDLIHSSAIAHPGPRAKEMSGMIAYHGEMWLAPQLRDRVTASLMNRFGILMCMREWSPDAVFGLMSWSLAVQGFNTRILYTHCEPMTITWDKLGGEDQYQVWLVYLERKDIDFLMTVPPSDIAQVLRVRSA